MAVVGNVVVVAAVIIWDHPIVLVCTRIPIIRTKSLSRTRVGIAPIAIIIIIVTIVVVRRPHGLILGAIFPLVGSNLVLVPLNLNVGNGHVRTVAILGFAAGIDTSFATVFILFLIPPSGFRGLRSFVIDRRRSSEGIAIVVGTVDAVTGGPCVSNTRAVAIVAVPSRLLQ